MSRILYGVFWFSVLLRLVSSPIFAESLLVINEFASDTGGNSSDPDWVELYNSSSENIDLTGYVLKDKTGNELQISGSVSSNNFITFDWSSRLNKDADSIQLLKDGTVVDEILYGESGLPAPGNSQSAGRRSDGSEEWVVFNSSTKGASNNSSVVVPTNTPIPTPTLTPTKIPTPTRTPTPTKTPTPTPAKSAIEKVVDDSDESSENEGVLGTEDPQATATSSFKIPLLNTSNKKTKASDASSLSAQALFANERNGSSISLIFGGILMLCACGILLFRQYKERFTI